jgi:hypothetical protein
VSKWTVTVSMSLVLHCRPATPLIHCVMHPRVPLYGAVIALLSLASAACLVALAVRYADAGARYQLSLMTYASLCIPSVICVAFWIWWRHPVFRVAGCCVALLLLTHCAASLIAFDGRVGGDMDFGAPFIALIYAIGCFVFSMIGLAVAGAFAFVRSRMHSKPLQRIAREDAPFG